MFCIGEFATLVLGIFTLVNGAFRLSRDRVVWGVPARVIGALLLLPLFVLFGALMTASLVLTIQDRQPNEDDRRRLLITILGIDVAILTVIFGIALATAKPVQAEKQAGEDADYEQDDLSNSGE
jgi:hypothetical protein